MVDRLEAMFVAQLELQQEFFGYDLATMSDEMRADYIRDMVLAATDELHEAMHEVPWKGWKSGTFNRPEYFGELIDVWALLMNLMLATGATPTSLADELSRQYAEKRERNAQRQKDGYGA